MSLDKAIDIVITWCDGNDPVFASRKKKRMREMGLKWDENNLGDMRYFDNEELRYSLRSIHKYLPWINHIFLVTDKQRPSWLVDNPKLTIIDHKEIIPSAYLPTFNSVTIESFIHHIPALAEKFLLFNDDFFINRPLSPSFFFDGDLPIVRLIKDKERWQFKSLEEAVDTLNTAEISSFRKTLINAWYLFSSKNSLIPFYVLAHTVDAYTRETFERVQQKYPELLARNVSPFRTDENIQRVLYQLEMIYFGGCRLEEVKPLTFIQKHMPMFSSKRVDSFEGTESPKTWKRIRSLKPGMFCLNAAIKNEPSVKAQSSKLLKELFPERSPYEN